ncbi:hypothetical protein ACHAXR_005453 [Thalassiosira sp. AJA248-18]
MMSMVIRASALFATCIVLLIRRAAGHGYLASPRSRNLFAFEEISWVTQTSDDPERETCPQCLNRGGSLARCGISEKRNYDAPRNALGGLMKTNIQATYTQGQEVVMDVTLTAHHKGHFVFSACPIIHGEVPSQDCFDKHQLTFVKDLLHGANFDPSYPERAYIAPRQLSGSPGVEVFYSFKMRLPPELYGDLVLIQWYYLTANSCIHEGYEEYDWPWDYGWNTGAMTPTPCGKLSRDGSGAPERFWNCAEVMIERSGGSGSSSSCGSNCEKDGGKNQPDNSNKPDAIKKGPKKKPNKDTRSGTKQKRKKKKPKKGKKRPGKKRRQGRKRPRTRSIEETNFERE